RMVPSFRSQNLAILIRTGSKPLTAFHSRNGTNVLARLHRDAGMIVAGKTEEQTGAEPRYTLGLRHENGKRVFATSNSDEFPLDSVHDRFQTVVGSQLLVDVMKVIPQGLRTDAENVSNLITILALCEPTEDVFFLVGQWGYWRCPHGNFADRTELLG